MKNRTDRMLLRAFLVSLLAYGILLFIYIRFSFIFNVSGRERSPVPSLTHWSSCFSGWLWAVMQCPSLLCSCCCAGEKVPALF